LTRAPFGGDDETSGDLNLTSAMDIFGGGEADTIVDASAITPTTRVLEVESGDVTIQDLTLRGGHAAGVDYGGGVWVGGSATLSLFRTSVASNTADFYGGGIYVSAGSLNLSSSRVTSNTAGADGGGIYIAGGMNQLSLTTVDNNTSLYGGGVWNSGDANKQLIILASTLSDNMALQGGGIYNEANLQALDSTISNNFADGSGAGIFNNTLGTCACQLNLYWSTLVGNLANQAVIGGTGGGLYNYLTSTLHIQSSLLDGNVRSTAGPDVFDDCSGLILSGDYNLISTTSGCSFASESHDKLNVPGLSGPLQNNGGPIFINPPPFTNALLPGSPAIDAIPKGALGCGTTELEDQRSRPRPAFGGISDSCDIGAVERQQVIFLPLMRN
jgi:hypothetical protein